MKIAISAESTIDLPIELLEKYNIHTIPFRVLLGDQEFEDGKIEPTDIFKYVKENKVLPKTSAINEFSYKEYFENLTKEYDAVVHICLSSQISCTHSNAEKVAKDFNNVYIIDSKTLSTGIALLAIYACGLRNNNLSAEEIYNETSKQVEKVQASFVIDKLEYLHKGGRCSMLSLLGANILKIHPQIMLKNGKMGVHRKYRGKMEKVVAEYCDDLLKEFSNPNLDVAFVTYTTSTEEIVAGLKEKLIAKGFKTIYETRAGATISSHCGEQTIGVLFLNN